MADLTVIAGKKETFSMIVAESLSCGTPAVGFKAGGPEGIAIKEYSGFVEYGDIDSLLELVKEFLGKEQDSKKISSLAHCAYDKQVMTQGYINAYKEVIG